MASRLLRGGHSVVVYDRSPSALATATQAGGIGAMSLEDLIDKLPLPRVVWLMLPAGPPTDDTLRELLKLLSPGDVVVDGGNSHYKESMARAQAARACGVELVDVGTSGGIGGLDHGYCLMAGGEAAAVRCVEPALLTLAPPGGYAHVGPSGAGHYAKMIHNGIEYGMLAAYGEGFELLTRSPFAYDLHQLAQLWRYGTVIRSFLLELLEAALRKDGKLDGIAGYVDDSGEGRWAAKEAIDAEVPAPVLTMALLERFFSRHPESFAGKVIAVLRREFGGHWVKPSSAGT
jgi:6-phosphogluconate dehydrogenase